MPGSCLSGVHQASHRFPQRQMRQAEQSWLLSNLASPKKFVCVAKTSNWERRKFCLGCRHCHNCHLVKSCEARHDQSTPVLATDPEPSSPSIAYLLCPTQSAAVAEVSLTTWATSPFWRVTCVAVCTISYHITNTFSALPLLFI